MNRMMTTLGNLIKAFPGSKYFYPLREDGLVVKTPVYDAWGNEIPGTTAEVPISEGKIISVLRDMGIEVVMADIGTSGEELAKDYIHIYKKRIEGNDLFVMGLDMGGDIFS